LPEVNSDQYALVYARVSRDIRRDCGGFWSNCER
jgi:hypothetical protein